MAATGLPAMWWLERLSRELGARQAHMQLMDRYYRGDHPLPFLTKAHEPKIRDAFRQLLDDSRSNFMRVVVDVVEERLQVEGFRLSASSDEETDMVSWDIWQANQMDAESQAAFVEALVKGVSYLSVWQGEKDGDLPVIAVEDPMQTIVAYEPGSGYRRRLAALKVWRDEWTGMQRANVYLPSGIFKFERKVDDSPRLGTPESQRMETSAASGWKELPDEFVGNPLGVVPIIPLRNRPRILIEGESELVDVYRVQNQINGFLFLLALAGYFGAHRQRWATGIKLTEDDQGRVMEPFDVAIDRLFFSEDKETKFGEFDQTDLTGYIKAIEQKVLHIAVTTRTPRHYLIEQGQSPSGDAIRSAETGLTKKVARKMRPFGEGLEDALRLARRFAGEADSPPDSEIVWADPQIRTEGEITDATIKKLQAGLITQEQALEDCGYSQTQIARMLASADGRAELEAALAERDASLERESSERAALQAAVTALAEELRGETVTIREKLSELATKEPPAPPAAPEVHVETTIQEGAVSLTLEDGALRTEIAEGAIQTTVQAPPATPAPNVEVNLPAPGTRRVTFPDGRTATIEEA